MSKYGKSASEISRAGSCRALSAYCRLLRPGYAVSSSGIGYAATKMCGSDISYGATIVLCGVRSGIAYADMWSPIANIRICGSNMGYAATWMCGTDIVYAPTRLHDDMWHGKGQLVLLAPDCEVPAS
eukprot:3941032-Rhodomonas_salina.3